MWIHYDAATDTLCVVFRRGPIAESVEDRSGAILDYDADGILASVEVLEASRWIDDPGSVIVTR